jgi:thioredoxin-related protein
MGCKQMDAVTYPNPAVVQFIEKNVVPVRILYNQQPLASQFKVKWTPTLILLDAEGNEVYRSEGFLPPDNLIPALILGIGKLELQHAVYDKAASHFSNIVSKYSESDEAPEAVYFLGVARFKATHDLKAMRDAYENLKAKYPKSSWTKKAQPYGAAK